VRDPRKLGALTVGGTPANLVYNLTDFQQGGEMMIVGIKSKSGAIGAAPVNWPDAATGITGPPPGGTNYDPYFFARKAVSNQ